VSGPLLLCVVRAPDPCGVSKHPGPPHGLGDGSSLGRVLAFEVPSASDPGGTRLRVLVLVVLKAADRVGMLVRYFVVTALALSRARRLLYLAYEPSL